MSRTCTKEVVASPVRVSWLDSAGLCSHIHLTRDGKDTLCEDHAEYLAHRHLVKSPNKEQGRSLYCRTCFMDSGEKYSHSLPWHPKCKDRDPGAPPEWSELHFDYVRRKYPGGFVVQEELMTKKKIFVVESCDEEEAQLFEDWVPAETKDVAIEEVRKLRGDYAVVCGAHRLQDARRFAKQKLERLERASGYHGVKRGQRDWDRFLEAEGELVRLNGKLLKLDSEEADRCGLCGKVYEPAGDSWGGLDPGCADKVSEYMENHGIDAYEAIKALKARRKR